MAPKKIIYSLSFILKIIYDVFWRTSNQSIRINNTIEIANVNDPPKLTIFNSNLELTDGYNSSLRVTVINVADPDKDENITWATTNLTVKGNTCSKKVQ